VLLSFTKVPGTVALTYDDGPSDLSNKLLDIFDQYNGKATFFINGNNKGRGMIDDPSTGWSAIIQRMFKQGHQVASHTWSHQSLDTISGAQRQAQIVYNEIAFGNILGRYPTYIRPPYSQCASDCQALMTDLAYHVINFDVDIEDAIGHPDLQTSINDFSGNLTTKSNPDSDSMLVIGHETSFDTVNKITETMLKLINTKGFKAVTVGECLDDPKSNWYRHMDGSLDPAPPGQQKTISDKLSTSPSTKAASVQSQSAATSSTISPLGTKIADQTIFSTSQPAIFATQGVQSSSISQTHPAIAIKSTSPSPSTTNLTSSTSLVIASTAKSSAPALAQWDIGLFLLVVGSTGTILNYVA
jgi:peptidoglycan/xylan/chitin deacetylase (PgdA/CDA1 family)